MKKYNIIIEETLSKVVRVEAETEDDAIDKIESMYGNQEIVLSADDFSGYQIMGYSIDETITVDIDFTEKEELL